MKKIIFFLAILISVPSFAQISVRKPNENMTREEWRQHMHNQKFEFYSLKMDLTEVEKSAFKVLFDEYDAKLRCSHSKIAKLKKEIKHSADEEKYAQILDAMQQEWVNRTNLKVKLVEDMTSVMPAEKTYKFLMAEKEFKKLLIKDIERSRNSTAK